MTGIEYERRFLVADSSELPKLPSGNLIAQGYLSVVGGSCVRVRRSYAIGEDDEFYEEQPTLTYKGPRVDGAREEDSSFVDIKTAIDLFKLCRWRIVKVRHSIVHANELWEVDVFLWENEGLIIAECEGDRPMTHVKRPSWASSEITDDTRYNNEELAVNPWKNWSTP